MAVYTLTSGADAFTMRETRDGLFRKTAVWTHADGAGGDRPLLWARSGERASRPFCVGGENGQDARSPDDGGLSPRFY